ncbi:CPNE8-like protein [Mya arenaria]|uniref:CPNE8-like protein n=1 Tax=Mya arenaria TaxID=6604 RepID=A0ABY7FWC6_MYAAR|nr:CPNE8-like protein [Mya arenaria]
MSARPAQFQAGTSAVPATQVEISVKCRGLRDLDTFSKSDPMCVMFTKDVKSGQFYEYGRTETIQDNLNPDFVKKFVINYFFEESQKLKFELYDVDSKSAKLSDHDFLGRMECTLGEVVAAGGDFQRPLIGQGKNCGKIICRAEELGNCKGLFVVSPFLGDALKSGSDRINISRQFLERDTNVATQLIMVLTEQFKLLVTMFVTYLYGAQSCIPHPLAHILSSKH